MRSKPIERSAGRLGKRTSAARSCAVLLSALVVLTGCAEAADEPAGVKTADSDIAPKPSSLTADLALPIEAYIFSETEIALVTRAMNSLAKDCMDKAGFDYEPGETTSPDIGVMDRRYGIANEHTAARYGYHFPSPGEEESPAKSLKSLGQAGQIALAGKQQADGSLDPDGGCIGEAKRKLAQDREFGPDELARQLNLKSYVDSQKDPRVLAAFSKWSSCMAGKGYRYKSLMNAIDDPKFGSKETDPSVRGSTSSPESSVKRSTSRRRSWKTSGGTSSRS